MGINIGQPQTCTVTTVRWDIDGAPPMRHWLSYADRVVMFRPAEMSLTVYDGKPDAILITGPKLKKDGTNSRNDGEWRGYYPSARRTDTLIPDWLIPTIDAWLNLQPAPTEDQ